jgi:hypothetical protein
MTPTEQINAFTAHVKELTDKFTESRSSLQNLLTYLRVPANQSKRFANVQAAKNKCANPADKRLGKYESALTSLVAVWGTSGDYKETPAPVSTGGGNAAELVNSVKAKLEACRLYACNDVGTFPQCVNTRISQSEQARIKKALPDKVFMPIVSPDRSWKGAELRGAYGQVVAKRAGECTNYGYYAAHILSQATATPKPRIEIVSWEGKNTAKHVFCIVGRTGGDTDGKLPPVAQWNDECVIVDCWALSLGHGCIYNKKNYCFPTMMHPSKVVMDSTKVSAEGPMNTQGGLKATGNKRW